MLDYKVISLYNKSNQFTVEIYQRTKTEFKVRTKIGFTSFSDDYCHGMYELARTCFFYIINGYEMTHNNLGFEFAYAIHSGVFTEFEPPFKEPTKKEEEPAPTPPPLTRTGYENSLPVEDPSILTRTENVIVEPAEEPPADLLIRSESAIQKLLQNPEVELPWKLAD
mgnify:CR=1 FL=1